MRFVLTNIRDSKSESEGDEKKQETLPNKFVLAPTSEVSLCATDHTAVPKPNLQHDQTRVPIFDTLSIDGDVCETDAIETQPVLDAIDEPVATVGTPGIKGEPTAAESNVLSESPGCYFIRFVKTKDESPPRDAALEKEEHLMDTDDLLPNVFSETDDEQNIVPPPTNLAPAISSPLPEAPPTLVNIKYGLFGNGEQSVGAQCEMDEKRTTENEMTPKAPCEQSRILKRHLTNEHNSSHSAVLFGEIAAPLNGGDLSKRVLATQLPESKHDLDDTQPLKGVVLFPPTQTDGPPMNPLQIIPTDATVPIPKQHEAAHEKAKPKPKAKRQRKKKLPEVVAESTHQENLNLEEGVSLGEYRTDDLGTNLIDDTKRGTTPIPTKATNVKRLTKSQRQALEQAGKTPPLNVRINPAKRPRSNSITASGGLLTRKKTARSNKAKKQDAGIENENILELLGAGGTPESSTLPIQQGDNKENSKAHANAKEEKPSLPSDQSIRHYFLTFWFPFPYYPTTQ